MFRAVFVTVFYNTSVLFTPLACIYRHLPSPPPTPSYPPPVSVPSPSLSHPHSPTPRSSISSVLLSTRLPLSFKSLYFHLLPPFCHSSTPLFSPLVSPLIPTARSHFSLRPPPFSCFLDSLHRCLTQPFPGIPWPLHHSFTDTSAVPLISYVKAYDPPFPSP